MSGTEQQDTEAALQNLAALYYAAGTMALIPFAAVNRAAALVVLWGIYKPFWPVVVPDLGIIPALGVVGLLAMATRRPSHDKESDEHPADKLKRGRNTTAMAMVGVWVAVGIQWVVVALLSWWMGVPA